MKTKIIKEFIFFISLLFLGVLTAPLFGGGLNFGEKCGITETIKGNCNTRFLISIPYIIFIIVRLINIFNLKKSFKFPWQQIYSFLMREIFYLVSFFILGYITMPWAGRMLGLINYEKSTLGALFNFEIFVYILILTPYIVFLITRLFLYNLRKNFLKQNFKQKNTHQYKEFYGKSRECACVGYKKTMEPNETFWGEGNQEWGVCFGLLYDCKKQ